MAGNIKGIIVEIGGDTSGLQKALSKVNSASSGLSKELRGINSLLKLDPKNTELLAQKQVILSKNIETTKNKLNQLKDIQAKALEEGIDKNEEQQENWRALQREIINTQNKLNKFLLEQSGWITSGRKIEEFGKKIEGIGSKLDNLGSKFTTRLTLPITALGAVVTKAGMEQEAAIQQVEKIYGEASKTIKEFANNTALNYNMSTKSAYKYSQIFGNLIQTITDDQKKNAQYTQELLKASSVIASATGRTMEDVMDRIRSGLLGNTEAIEDLGVNVNVALLESTDSFRKFAGDKSWKQLDFQTQQQIRLFAILEQTTKKYGDEVNVNTTSKVQKLTAKLENLGNKLSSKLLPIVDKWLDKADKWLDKLDDLDEGTLDNIVSIGLFVAAFGPAIKIIGKLTSTLGTGIKSLGKYTQKIGELDVAAKTTNSSLTKVTSSIGSFAGKASLVVGGTTLIISGLMALDKKINETYHNSKEKTDSLIDSLNDEIESRQNVLKSVNKMLSSNLSEIEHTESLKRELDSLVEANGKVKNGYESRANFILNELNKALETEYYMTGNMIEQYDELSSTIDDLIIKKEAQIILEANEEKYKNVIDKRTEAYKNYNATQNELLKVKRDIEEINKKPYLFEGSRLNDLNEAEKQYKKLASILSSLGNEIKEYDKDIVTYEENTRLALEGGADNYKKIVNSINTTTVALKDGNEKNLRESLKNTQEYIEEQKKYYDIDLKLGIETNRKKYEENIKSGEQQVEQLTQNLIEQTSTIQKLSPDVVSSWVALAQNSRAQYNEAISKMPKDMQDKINEITAFVRGDLSVKDAVKQLGEDAVKQLQISDKFEETGKNWIRGITAGINNKLVRQEALSSMYGFGVDGLNAIKQQAWNEHSPSKETEKAAINLLKGITIGLDKEKGKTINKMLFFGKDLIRKFNGIMNYNLNSLEDIPNINATIKRNVNTVLQPKILQPNIVINTQKLDNSEMNRIIDTVNRRFGMQI